MLGEVTSWPSHGREVDRGLIRLASFAQHTEKSRPNRQLTCRHRSGAPSAERILKFLSKRRAKSERVKRKT
jgi:hypothetical protein